MKKNFFKKVITFVILQGLLCAGMLPITGATVEPNNDVKQGRGSACIHYTVFNTDNELHHVDIHFWGYYYDPLELWEFWMVDALIIYPRESGEYSICFCVGTGTYLDVWSQIEWDDPDGSGYRHYGQIFMTCLYPDTDTYYRDYLSEYSGGCFLENTPITLADGSLKDIEDIQVGEMVLSFDEDNNQYVSAPVTQVFRHDPQEMGGSYMIINNQLKVTPNHPIYVNNKWMPAINIDIGDSLFGLNGCRVPVRSIQYINKNAIVYNLEVDTYHNYFAGQILVHNKMYVYMSDTYPLEH